MSNLSKVFCTEISYENMTWQVVSVKFSNSYTIKNHCAKIDALITKWSISTKFYITDLTIDQI